MNHAGLHAACRERAIADTGAPGARLGLVAGIDATIEAIVAPSPV